MEKITLEEALKKVEKLREADYWNSDTCYKTDVEDLVEKIYKSFEENREYSEAEIASWNGMGK